MITGLAVGLIIGFVFSMPPLGPTYFAIIEKGLKKQLKNAVAIGAGAGFMDMIYILVSYGGVEIIVSLLPESANVFFRDNEDTIKIYLAFLGCIVIILYGIKIIRSKPDKDIQKKEPVKEEIFNRRFEKVESAFKKTEVSLDKLFHTNKLEKSHTDITGSFLTGVVMCLSSPTIAASWFATVGYLKSYGIINSNFFTGLFLALGVMTGTTLWFYLLTKIIFKNLDKFNENVMKKLNMFTGIFLLILGIVLLYKISSSLIS